MITKFIRILIFSIMFLYLFVSCSDDDKPNSPPNFDDLVNEGWSDFSNKNYDTALQIFLDANSIDSERYEAYSGIGWSLFKLDELQEADTAFAQGSVISNASEDIFAGWAFSLNAQKQYLNSNIQADSAFAINPSWNFQYDLSLNHNDLNILRAENHFLLGNFINSYSIVQILNPDFDANIATSGGQAALAVEIERLKGIL